jgi:mannose-1-phosphate guanylyltransferase
MFQNTLQRLKNLETVSPIIVCNADHRFLVAEQLKIIGQSAFAIILEPVGRNTAPAIALAALEALKSDDEAIVLVLPADHVIKDQKEFENAVNKAKSIAEDGSLVTFGITPREPHIGYGYIKSGEAHGKDGYSVEQFAEKPSLEKAKEYVASGKYFWNSGMFMFKASRYIEELEKHAPEIMLSAKKAFMAIENKFDFSFVDENLFSKCPSISIDYAIMEKTDRCVVVPLDANWSDVGSWSALWDANNKCDQGNILSGDVIAQDTKNCYIHSDNKLVATLGVEDLIVIETKDAVLVAHIDKSEEIKQIVETINKSDRPEATIHREVYRPWGKYDSIGTGERDQVKRITVNPGAKLSLQMHNHRSEHWIVVKGSAKVTKGDETFTLLENQSTYIPVGMTHALENPNDEPLEMIEVQTGDYLGEDDIVRFEDKYGRI